MHLNNAQHNSYSTRARIILKRAILYPFFFLTLFLSLYKNNKKMTLTNSRSFVRKGNEPENGTIAAETVTTANDDDNNEKKCTFQQVKFQYLAICCGTF